MKTEQIGWKLGVVENFHQGYFIYGQVWYEKGVGNSFLTFKNDPEYLKLTLKESLGFNLQLKVDGILLIDFFSAATSFDQT